MSVAERDEGDARLTVGDLAAMAGVGVPILRKWEKDFGFPGAHRTRDGARRYRADQVAGVQRVLQLREDGVALSRAIDEAKAVAAAALPSVFSAVCDARPDLEVARLSKRVLAPASRALEDECLRVSELPLFFGMFQSKARFRPAQLRWSTVASSARSTLVFGDFARLVEDPDSTAPVLVPLPAGSVLRGEWVVVCEAAEFRGVLVAREVPGAQSGPEPDRLFDAVWSVDPDVVRTASRVCARVAAASGSVLGEELIDELALPAGAGPDRVVAADSLHARMLEYTRGLPAFGRPHR